MKSFLLKAAVSTIVCLNMFACQKSLLDLQVTDSFFLRNGEAVMPVTVHGNTASKVFLVLLHGGPGYTSFEAYQDPKSPYTRLQEDYAVVYWDQRCAGNSQGNCDYPSLTLDTYTDDLVQLVALLKQRYAENIQIFLLGHSWGGSLGIQYLAETTNQDNITGWIEVSGGHDVPRISNLERSMILEVGNRQMALGNEVEAWEDLMSEASTLQLNSTEAVFQMNRLARRAEGLMARVDSVNRQVTNFDVSDFFFSPLDLLAMPKNGEATIDALEEELVQLNLTGELSKITIPTLMIWGRYDFRVPPALAQADLAKYGADQKNLVIFEQSAHFSQWDEPDRFYQEVARFIEMAR